MEKKLTREEVLHVAELARIKINEEEIEKYQIELQQLLNDVEKINDVQGYDDEILIAPWNEKTITRKDESGEIRVGSTPVTTYKYCGKAMLIFANGDKAVKDIEIPVCVPQLGADFGSSSLDLQSYTLTFDCNTDENGDFLIMKNGTKN